ncbi:hypothetical protein RB195_012977 [Necator americanus]|uniref:Uncharacterized protein n=1 Tax=Necator americanus TaxID=51031 RepID=A0ABR1DTH1_NECAM
MPPRTLKEKNEKEVARAINQYCLVSEGSSVIPKQEITIQTTSYCNVRKPSSESTPKPGTERRITAGCPQSSQPRRVVDGISGERKMSHNASFACLLSESPAAFVDSLKVRVDGGLSRLAILPPFQWRNDPPSFSR